MVEGQEGGTGTRAKRRVSRRLALGMFYFSNFLFHTNIYLYIRSYLRGYE